MLSLESTLISSASTFGLIGCGLFQALFFSLYLGGSSTAISEISDFWDYSGVGFLIGVQDFYGDFLGEDLAADYFWGEVFTGDFHGVGCFAGSSTISGSSFDSDSFSSLSY